MGSGHSHNGWSQPKRLAVLSKKYGSRWAPLIVKHFPACSRFPWVDSYHNIVRRCENPKCKEFETYGGRGIRCKITPLELLDLFFQSSAWKFPKPTVDRLNQDGHYELGNVRWVDFTENLKSIGMNSVYQRPRFASFQADVIQSGQRQGWNHRRLRAALLKVWKQMRDGEV